VWSDEPEYLSVSLIFSDEVKGGKIGSIDDINIHLV